MLYLDWTFAQSQMSTRIGWCHEMLVLVHQVTRDCLKHLFTQSPNEACVCKPQWWRCDLPTNNEENCPSTKTWCQHEEAKGHVFLNIGGKYSSLMQRWQDGHPCSSSTPCSQLVPPLLSSPRIHMTWRNTSCHDLTAKNWYIWQVNKQHKHKYGKLLTKLVITNPCEKLCVDLIGPHTLRGKDGTEIDFMFLTMIDQATSWFQIVELPVTTDAVLLMDTKRHKGTKTHNQLNYHTLTNHLQWLVI